LWAYSFKVGVYFIILGATLRTEMSSGRKWNIGISGLVYIVFALSPEKMIEYGLQGEAAAFVFHILIELIPGWLFTSLSFRKEKNDY